MFIVCEAIIYHFNKVFIFPLIIFFLYKSHVIWVVIRALFILFVLYNYNNSYTVTIYGYKFEIAYISQKNTIS